MLYIGVLYLKVKCRNIRNKNQLYILRNDNENIPPQEFLVGGYFHIIETSYTVPSMLLRISKLGLGGSIVHV